MNCSAQLRVDFDENGKVLTLSQAFSHSVECIHAFEDLDGKRNSFFPSKTTKNEILDLYESSKSHGKISW